VSVDFNLLIGLHLSMICAKFESSIVQFLINILD